MGWDGADVMGLARWADMMGWCLGCLLVTSRALTAGGLMVNLQSCPKKEGFCDHFFCDHFLQSLHAKSECIFSTLANSYWLQYCTIGTVQLYFWLM